MEETPTPESVEDFDLHTDPERELTLPDATGIYIRAVGSDGKWGTYDIAQLDQPSLLAFTRSRGPVNEWAAGIITALMGFRPDE